MRQARAAEGTLPADLEPVVDLVAQGYLDRDRPDNMAPCSSPAPKSLSSLSVFPLASGAF